MPLPAKGLIALGGLLLSWHAFLGRKPPPWTPGGGPTRLQILAVAAFSAVALGFILQMPSFRDASRIQRALRLGLVLLLAVMALRAFSTGRVWPLPMLGAAPGAALLAAVAMLL